MKGRDNRQDLATSWDSCAVEFQIPGKKYGMRQLDLEKLCMQLDWPVNWRFRGCAELVFHGVSDARWCFKFNVTGPPRAADGAYVRAKLNMIPENFNEHTDADQALGATRDN